MRIKEAEAHVKSRIWKAIAQSGLDLSMLPEESLETLVNLVSEAALVEMDYGMGREDEESGLKDSAEPPVEAGEQVLWEGRPFLSLTKHYRITDERIRITEGLMGKQRIDIELVKIQDITQSQRMSERMLNLGDITVKSHDPTNPIIVLDNISDVQNVHEVLRRAMIDARAKVNFSYREQM
ncbi:MAG: PH domain-containing protein [Candidatus Promineifilaceae bacterium]